MFKKGGILMYKLLFLGLAAGLGFFVGKLMPKTEIKDKENLMPEQEKAAVAQ